MERKVEEKGIPLQIHLAMLLVVLFWGIQVGAKGFAISTANPVYNLISLALVPVAMAKIVFNRYDPKVIIRCGLLFLTAAGIMLTTGDTRALIIALSVLAFKDVSMEKIMGMTFVVRGISFAMRIMLCLAGVLDKEVNDLGECGFGFGHSNLAHGEFFCIFAAFLLWKLKNVNLCQLGLLNLANIALFVFTRSKTPFILVIGMSMMVLMTDQEWFRRFLRICVPNIFVVLSVVTIALSLLYYKMPLQIHATFFSRFQTAFYMFRIYKLNLFGNDVRFLNDLGYVDLLFTFGVPWMLLFVGGHTLLGIYYSKRSNWTMLIYLLIISLYFTMEAYAESVLYNYCWLYYSVLLFKKDSPFEQLYIRLTKEAL